MSMAAKDDVLPSLIKNLSLSDDSLADITVCCWNIMGEAKVEYRKKVTTATFQHQYSNSSGSGETSLGQADIICIQEMSFSPDGEKASDYLPFLNTKGTHMLGAYQSEPGVQKRNGVFFKDEKFKIAANNTFEQAFELMEYKRTAYKKIANGGGMMIDKALQGELSPDSLMPSCCDNKAEKEMCSEVLEECKALHDYSDFHCILARFRGPKDSQGVTKSPKELLKNRMGICCLELRSLRGYKIVVISVHNYHKSSGKGASQAFACLLFDFVKKIKFPVLIAGDFNLNIMEEPSLKTFVDNNCVESYPMRALREGEKCIDFILINGKTLEVTSPRPPAGTPMMTLMLPAECFPHSVVPAVGPSIVQPQTRSVQTCLVQTCLLDTKAHDLQVPDDEAQKDWKAITNHNPLSATLRVKVHK